MTFAIRWEESRYQDAAKQAANCALWLAQSGQKYRQVKVWFDSIGWNFVRVIASVGMIRITQSHMSFASWRMCRSAAKGDVLDLLVRDDPARRVA